MLRLGLLETIISSESHSLAARDRPFRDPFHTGSADDFAAPGGPARPPRDGPLRILWRQRGIIIAALALSLLGAGLYLVLAQPIYRAQASLDVQPVGAPVRTGHDTFRTSAPVSVNLFREADLITSTHVLAHSLGEPSIQELKTFQDVENRFDYLKSNLKVEIGAANDLLTVTLDSPYREDAAHILESVVQSYKDFQTKKGRTATDHLLDVLSKERNGLEEALELKAGELVAFKRERGVLLDENDRSDIHVERVKRLAEALTAAQLETIAAKSAYEDAVRPISGDAEKMKQVEDLQSYHGLTPVSAADEALLRAELYKWQTQLGDLRQRYLQNHPTVRALQKRVDQLNIAYVAAMERRWKSAERREAELQEAFDKQQKVAVDRSADAVAYARLEQDVKTKEQQIQAIDKQIREANLLDPATVIVEVIEPPRVPQRPALPDRQRTLAIALLAGLIVGLGLALVRDWMDPRLRSTEEVKAVLRLPILAMIPRLPENLAPAVRGQKLLLDPDSEAAEAYRALRTAIKFGVPEGRAKTILIASPAVGDGKTTVASNLAIALAQSGKRVLLLDADLRDPRQHETFGAENHTGLADVLAHDVTLAEALQKTVVANLEIVPAGPTADSPSDLLNSQRFVEVIEELTDRYDHVVIDSPPLLSATDSRIIAASCDVTVLVLRADRADRKASEMSRDGLLSVGANLLGLVMNYAAPGGGVYSGDTPHHNGGSGPRRRSTSSTGTSLSTSTAAPRGADDQGEHAEHDSRPLVVVDALKSLKNPS